MDKYTIFKSLHLLGVVIFLGNIIVTALWKTLADRTGDAKVVAFSQRLVTVTDFVFTAGGLVLLAVGGYGMVLFTDVWSFSVGWINLGQTLFTLTGVVWVGALIPIQFMQARMARSFADGGEIPTRYRKLSMLWMVFGAIATLLPLLTLFIMVFKPA